MPLTPFSMTLNSGKTVPTVHVPPGTPLTGLARALDIPFVNGAVAVVGGAALFDEPEYETVRQKVKKHLSELAEVAIRYQLAVVDGGTPFGVMRLMGEACHQHNYRFPLVGVAPSGKVLWNTNKGLNYQQTWYTGLNVRELMQRAAQQLTPLDMNHSAFVLVEANEWGDEVEMLASVAHELAHPQPVLEILINGGEIARRDIFFNLQRGGQVLVMEGSGRFADDLAAAVRRGHTMDAEMQRVVDTRRIHLFTIDDPPRLFAVTLLKYGKWT